MTITLTLIIDALLSSRGKSDWRLPYGTKGSRLSVFSGTIQCYHRPGGQLSNSCIVSSSSDRHLTQDGAAQANTQMLRMKSLLVRRALENRSAQRAPHTAHKQRQPLQECYTAVNAVVWRTAKCRWGPTVNGHNMQKSQSSLFRQEASDEARGFLY